MLETIDGLPSSITIHTGLRVAICSLHNSSYVKTKLGRHLQKEHQVNVKIRREILNQIDIAETISDVTRPIDGGSPVPGLPIYDAFKCNEDMGSCRYITINKDGWRKHLRQKHSIRSESRGKKLRDTDSRYSCVRVQTLFAKKGLIDYFIINHTSEQISSIAG